MEINVRAFGIAKDILGFRERQMMVEQGETILGFKERLLSEYPDFERLVSLAFAVNEAYCSEDFVLQALDEVVIIPPVSGG